MAESDRPFTLVRGWEPFAHLHSWVCRLFTLARGWEPFAHLHCCACYYWGTWPRIHDLTKNNRTSIYSNCTMTNGVTIQTRYLSQARQPLWLFNWQHQDSSISVRVLLQPERSSMSELCRSALLYYLLMLYLRDSSLSLHDLSMREKPVDFHFLLNLPLVCTVGWSHLLWHWINSLRALKMRRLSRDVSAWLKRAKWQELEL